MICAKKNLTESRVDHDLQTMPCCVDNDLHNTNVTESCVYHDMHNAGYQIFFCVDHDLHQKNVTESRVDHDLHNQTLPNRM